MHQNYPTGVAINYDNADSNITPELHKNHEILRGVIKSKDIERFKELLKELKMDANAKIFYPVESTLLMEAIFFRSMDIIKYLIDNKADVNQEAISKFNNYSSFGIPCSNQFPLINAVLTSSIYDNDLKLIEYLVDNKADINKTDSSKSTSLHVGAVYSSIDVVDYLVKNGASITAIDCDGYTPLHCAMRSNRIKIAKYLIEAGSNVNIRDKKGFNVLDYFMDFHCINDNEDNEIAKLINLFLLNYETRGISSKDIALLTKLQVCNKEYTSDEELSTRMLNVCLLKEAYSKSSNRTIKKEKLKKLDLEEEELINKIGSIDFYFADKIWETEDYTLEEKLNDRHCIIKYFKNRAKETPYQKEENLSEINKILSNLLHGLNILNEDIAELILPNLAKDSTQPLFTMPEEAQTLLTSYLSTGDLYKILYLKRVQSEDENIDYIYSGSNESFDTASRTEHTLYDLGYNILQGCYEKIEIAGCIIS